MSFLSGLEKSGDSVEGCKIWVCHVTEVREDNLLE